MKGTPCELWLPCIFTESKRLVGGSVSSIAAALAAKGRWVLQSDPEEPSWMSCL